MAVTEQTPTPEATEPLLPDFIVFYDGVCVLCNEGMRALMKLDTDRILRFAPLQGQTATRLGIDWDDDAPDHEATFRFVDTRGDQIKISERMTAVADELEAIGRLPVAVAAIRATPSILSDAVYGVIAGLRYRLFGRYDECRLPTPEERELFLP